MTNILEDASIQNKIKWQGYVMKAKTEHKGILI